MQLLQIWTTSVGFAVTFLIQLEFIKIVDSSFVPPLIYAVLGSSRDLAVGPVSIASLIMGSMLRQEVSPATDPLLFLQLAFSSTFFAGLFQASLGFLRCFFINAWGFISCLFALFFHFFFWRKFNLPFQDRKTICICLVSADSVSSLTFYQKQHWLGSWLELQS